MTFLRIIAAVLCSSDIKNEDLAHAFKSALKLFSMSLFLGFVDGGHPSGCDSLKRRGE